MGCDFEHSASPGGSLLQVLSAGGKPNPLHDRPLDR